MENFQTFLHFRNLKFCEHFNLPTCIQLEAFFIVHPLNIQCFMIHTHSVYEISSQDCHIICWSQNNYKVLQITLSEWLVITLLNIKYLNFLFNGEILSSCISHQYAHNLSKPKYIHILEKAMLMIGFLNIMVQLARLKFMGLTL